MPKENKGLITSYIHYHEYDYGKNHPTLVLQSDTFGSVGYDIDEHGNLTRCCICAAGCDEDCVCGYSDF